jgi:hypothetical protein
MNDKQRKFWGPYIAALGFENFYTNGMFIQSKHYCGMDISQAKGAEEFGASQLEGILRKHTIYQDLLKKPSLGNEDLSEIFTWLVEKPFFDEELVRLFTNYKLDLTDEEYWELVKDIWCRQELNSDGNRKKNWKLIFNHRPRLPSLTEELPDTFTAYRAGKTDGFSWSLDKKTAEWFHNRFKSKFGNIPFLTNKFTKEDVVFYTNDRNEQEVVVIPSKSKSKS